MIVCFKTNWLFLFQVCLWNNDHFIMCTPALQMTLSQKNLAAVCWRDLATESQVNDKRHIQWKPANTKFEGVHAYLWRGEFEDLSRDKSKFPKPGVSLEWNDWKTVCFWFFVISHCWYGMCDWKSGLKINIYLRVCLGFHPPSSPIRREPKLQRKGKREKGDEGGGAVVCAKKIWIVPTKTWQWLWCSVTITIHHHWQDHQEDLQHGGVERPVLIIFTSPLPLLDSVTWPPIRCGRYHI